MDDTLYVALVVAEVLRRQPMDSSTEALVRVAVQTEDKATVLLKAVKEEAAAVAVANKRK